MKSPMLRWGAFLFGLFHVYTNMFASLSELWFAAIHFGGFCALFALGNNERAGLSRVQKSINVALAVLAVLVPAYLILFEDALYARESEFMVTEF